MGYIVQCIGLICAIIGISGAAGALERETGMIQSVILLAAGMLILYGSYKKAR